MPLLMLIGVPSRRQSGPLRAWCQSRYNIYPNKLSWIAGQIYFKNQIAGGVVDLDGGDVKNAGPGSGEVLPGRITVSPGLRRQGSQRQDSQSGSNCWNQGFHISNLLL